MATTNLNPSIEGVLTCIPGIQAEEDLSSAQHKFVKAGTVPFGAVLNDTEGGPVLGVLQNKPEANAPAAVAFHGVSKVKVGPGGLTVGAQVMSSATGLGIAATAELFAVGVALNDAAEDEIASVLLLGGTYTPAA